MDHNYETFLFTDNDTFPNNEHLAVIIYQQVFVAEPSVDPVIIERLFMENGWLNSWRDGLFREHHYHSTAHEVLGIFSGWVKAQLGGPGGKMFMAGAGDVIIVPAGVSHCNIEQSPDFLVIGAYPEGQHPDMNYGRHGERPGSDENIIKVPLPPKDPVFGPSGPLAKLWS